MAKSGKGRSKKPKKSESKEAEVVPVSWRLVSPQDHYLAIQARNETEARTRWPEFYPHVPVETVTCEMID